MSAAARDVVSFRVMKKAYEVACPAAQRAAFARAVKLLQDRTRRVHAAEPGAAVDRVAVVAALNLSHDCLRLRRDCPDELLPRLTALSDAVQATLDRAQELNRP